MKKELGLSAAWYVIGIAFLKCAAGGGLGADDAEMARYGFCNAVYHLFKWHRTLSISADTYAAMLRTINDARTDAFNGGGEIIGWPPRIGGMAQPYKVWRGTLALLFSALEEGK